MFQVSDNKERNFLDLLNDNLSTIELMYSKEGSWLKYFGHSNSLYARATRAIVNHSPIGEYWLRFFPREEFACPCSKYPIKTRRHILHECIRFNKYWNPRRDTIAHFTLFLEFNSFPSEKALLSCPWWLWAIYIVLFYFLILLLFSFLFLFFLSSCCSV